MAQEWTVEWVGEESRIWNGQHGQFIDYNIALAGWDGTATLTQKPETTPPQVGQTIYGSITVKDFKSKAGEDFQIAKLKKERRPDFNKAPAQAQLGAAPNGGFDGRSARIERQAAWKAAATLVSNMDEPDKGIAFGKWLTWLSEDLDAYEKARSLTSLPTVDEVLPEQPKQPVTSGVAPSDPPILGFSDDDEVPF